MEKSSLGWSWHHPISGSSCHGHHVSALSLYCFPRKFTIFQWSGDYTRVVTFANNTEHNVFKACDVHHSVVVLWRGCQSQRSTSCWGIWLQYETTSPVWQLCPSEESSCTAPDPTSNSNGYWAEAHMFRTAMLYSHNLQCKVYIFCKQYYLQFYLNMMHICRSSGVML